MLKFGIPDTRNDTFVNMNSKSLAFIIPGILLGHYIDKSISKLNLETKRSVALQTFINIFIIYFLNKLSYSYAIEFQLTFAGLFFSSLYFGMQTNYIDNIKKILDG